MEACPPHVATNTGHSSDPNYSPDAGLKPKGAPSAIRKCDPPLPTCVSTWEENREFFLFQEVCSNDVPFLTEHQVKKVFPSRFIFLHFFLISPHSKWVNCRDKSKLETGWKRAQGQGAPEGMWSPDPKVKLSFWVQAGWMWDQHPSPVGSLVLQPWSCSAFDAFASLGCRADGREAKLMRNETVRYFVKKAPPPPQIYPESSASVALWTLDHLIIPLWQVQGPPVETNDLLTPVTCTQYVSSDCSLSSVPLALLQWCKERELI